MMNWIDFLVTDVYFPVWALVMTLILIISMAWTMSHFEWKYKRVREELEVMKLNEQSNKHLKD